MRIFAIYFILSFAKCFASHVPNYITEDEFAAVREKPIEISNTSFPVSQYDQSFQQNARPGFGPRLWENGIVPYTLDPSFDKIQRAMVAQAILAYHDNTCIRFVPKQSNDKSWVDILHDPNVCGRASMCRNSGAQYAKFGGNCISSGVMIHELGHTLCMGHEQKRMDRDEWIDWDTAKCQPQDKDSLLSHGLHKLYDYVSSQHFEGECSTGCIIPKEPGVPKCGSGGPLSVLDIEILNEMYGCNSGCHGYRFVNSKNELIDPVITGQDRTKGYLNTCRAYYHGNIIPGKYFPDHKHCYVGYGGQELRLEGDHVEVLTNPYNVTLSWRRANNPPSKAIKGGRTSNRLPLYAIRCLLRRNDRSIWTPGHFHPSAGAYTSYGGKEINCTPGLIEFLVC